jgi:hypothetical protein
MKKVIVFLTVVMCMGLGISMTALAQTNNSPTPIQVIEEDDEVSAYADDIYEPPRIYAGRGTVENPVSYWETSGYPDNVSFAYELDSVWYIGIINADDASIQELVDLLSPNIQVMFIEGQQHSFNQRKAVVDEINASRDRIIRRAAMNPKSEVIFIEVTEGYQSEYMMKLSEQYGMSFIAVDDVNAAIGAVPGGLAGNGNNLFDYWFIPILLILIGTAIVVFFKRNRLIPAMQTANGNVVTENAPVSTKQIVAFIKNSALTPSDDVFKSIMEKVNNTKVNTHNIV